MIVNKNNHHPPKQVIKRQVDSEVKEQITDEDKAEIKSLLTQLAEELFKTGEVNEDVYLELIKLSPRKDDSALLNKLISAVEIWKSYNEDFDEEVDFPTEQYYEELIRII